MERVFSVMYLAFGLLVLPFATATIINNAKTLPPTGATGTNQVIGANNNNPLIEKACVNAHYKDFCIQTLKSQPGSAKADIKTLTFISLNVTKTFGATVADWVAQKNEDPEMGPDIEQAINDCVDQYNDAIAQLEDSLVAFFSNALNDVKMWTETALLNANTCQEGLKASSAGDTMGDRNQVFSQYITNTLDILNELSKQKL